MHSKNSKTFKTLEDNEMRNLELHELEHINGGNPGIRVVIEILKKCGEFALGYGATKALDHVTKPEPVESPKMPTAKEIGQAVENAKITSEYGWKRLPGENVYHK